MDIEKFKEELKKYKNKVKFKKHALVRVIERKIDPKLIISHVENPDKLLDVVPQEPKVPGEKKYRLLFELSRNRKLALVVVMEKGYLYVVTTFIKYRKWDKMVRRWKRK